MPSASDKKNAFIACGAIALMGVAIVAYCLTDVETYKVGIYFGGALILWGASLITLSLLFGGRPK
jgi:hypothetical protein